MARIGSGQCGLWAGILCLSGLMLAGCDAPEPKPAAQLPYADEYPGVGYARREPQAAVGELARRVAAGTAELDFDAAHGYLESVLAELEIDPSSQVLVFSRTSLQTRFIGPASPRAIYFNDENYVAFVPGAPALEIASYDAGLTQVFHRIVQDPAIEPVVARQFGTCLRCHDTYALAGGGVPRFLIGSGYTGSDGELVSHEAWILTGQETPLSSRWGGWYVTGRHGDEVHLGNIVVDRPEDLQDLESLRVGNVEDLRDALDTSQYLTPYSDIVALMVLEHQIAVQNRISRLRFEADSAAGGPLDDYVDALLREMLLVDAVALESPIEGTSGYQAYFESLGPFDSEGRSLRELDLKTRLFRYPLSYLIYSAGFQGLPQQAKSMVYARLRDILAGPVPGFAADGLSSADRAAIAEILRQTLPEVFEPQTR